jgi:hypothetical protein
MYEAAVVDNNPVNKVRPTDSVPYPVGKLSAKAGQEFDAKLSKVEIVALDSPATLALANVTRYGLIKAVLL